MQMTKFFSVFYGCHLAPSIEEVMRNCAINNIRSAMTFSWVGWCGSVNAAFILKYAFDIGLASFYGLTSHLYSNTNPCGVFWTSSRRKLYNLGLLIIKLFLTMQVINGVTNKLQ